MLQALEAMRELAFEEGPQSTCFVALTIGCEVPELIALRLPY